MSKRLGFIGLGNMGSRLAVNLAERSGQIVIWDRNPARRTINSSKKVESRSSIAELVGDSDIIFLSLSDDRAVSDVIGEIQRSDLEGKLICDFSTIKPETSIELAKRVSDKKGSMVDAAVSGSTPQVESKQLTLFVGGSVDDYETIRPFIEPLGWATYHMGPNGAGLKMKLSVNALLGIGIAALAESLTFAEKLGLQRDLVIEALEGTAVISPSQKSKLEIAKSDDYSKATFSLALMRKDLGLVLEEAQLSGLSLPVTTAAQSHAETSMSFGADKDFAVMIQVYEKTAK